MRSWAAVLAALTACSETTAIRVRSMERSTSVAIVDDDCACDRAFGCWRWSDVSTGNEPAPCTCSSSCDDAMIELVRGDEVFGARIGNTAAWMGDFAGWTLSVRGCGGELSYTLPTRYPDPPRIVGGTNEGVIWHSPLGTTRAEVSSAPGFYGGYCRVPGDQMSATVGAGGMPITVTTILDGEPRWSSIGTVYPSTASDARFE